MIMFQLNMENMKSKFNEITSNKSKDGQMDSCFVLQLSPWTFANK